MKQVDIIVTGEFVVKDAFSHPISDGAVAILGDEIEFVGQRSECLEHYKGQRYIERPKGLVIPGLINAHTHAPMTLFRGLADDLPLKTWLEEHIFPREARLTPDLIALGTELACAEMIRSGTTSFIDMYLFEDTICEVISRVGLRAWLGEGLFDFPSPAFSSGFEALEETRRLLDKWGDHPKITITVDPHTPYTCGHDLLRRAGELADEIGALLVIHLSETEWEVAEIQRRYRRTPARYLDDLGLLGPRTIAVHVVHPTEDEIGLLSDRGVKVVHCPESNQKLGSGVAPVAKMLDAGVRVLLGTDGAASNNDLNMFGEMGSAARLSKGIGCDPTALPATHAFAMATMWAGEALGVSGLGTLSPGAPADLAVLDLDSPHLRPCYNPVSHLVYCATAGDVQDLICGGEILMEDFKLTTIDEEDLFLRVEKVASELT